MLEWFIVAFISMPNTDQLEIKQMEKSFISKDVCVKYLQETPGIINDIMILEPTNTGMWFECLDTNVVSRLKVKRKSI
jgi:hypothetical protein